MEEVETSTLTDEILAVAPTVGPAAGEEGWDEWWDTTDGPYIRFYDREGRRISRRDWLRLCEWDNGSYRRIGEETVGPYWVSTVWLCFDHNLGGGPPLIFETMVFNNDTDETDVDVMQRYATEAEARAGHAEVVERVKLLWEASK